MITKPLSRRRLLSRSGLAVAGFQLAAMGSGASATVPDAVEVLIDPDAELTHFSARQGAILADVADIMIPETDTPGAIASGTVQVMDQLMGSWADDETRTMFAALPDALDLMAKDHGGTEWLTLAKPLREKLLTALDAASFSRTKPAIAPAYRKVKGLVFHVHYTSAEANPDYVLIPGGYYGNLSFDEYRALIEERKLQQG